MAASFFVCRYVLVLVLATVVISLAQYLKRHTVAYSVREDLTWGAISSLVYTSVLAYKLRPLRATAGPGGTNEGARIGRIGIRLGPTGRARHRGSLVRASGPWSTIRRSGVVVGTPAA